MTTRSLRETATLAGVACTVSLSALRVFTDGQWLGDVVLLVTCGMVLPAVLRRLRLPVWCWLPLSIAITGLVLIGRHLGFTTWWGLPTGHTVDELGEVWQFARENLESARPPVRYDSEWGLLFGVAFSAVIVVSTVVALVARSPRWALLPLGAGFSMFVVFGRGDGATALTAVFVVAMLVALVVLAPSAPPLTTNTVATPWVGRRHLAAAGVVVVTTVIGVGVGPAVPGADDTAWIPVRGRSAGALLLDHPIVDIRGRLVDQSTVELFQVSSNRPSYWRLASLAEFDGITFTVPRRQLFRLDLDTTTSAEATLRHEVTITGLPGRLVPAAPQPVQVNRSDVRFNPDTASLVTSRLLDDGDLYVIASAPPTLTAGRLMGPATTAAGPVPDPLYTALPAALPTSVGATARVVVERWGLDPDLAVQQPYVTALALQDWFRRNFDYRVDVTYGRDADAISAFLARREGYCEQFAIAFAVMARTLGLPARVAVGFTPGQLLDDGVWSVQGRHSHAWPELWFADVGWVGFEPTPGRGAPGAETYTGLPAAQDGDGRGQGEGEGSGIGGGDRFQPGAAPGDRDSQNDRDPFLDLDVVPDVPLGDVTLEQRSGDVPTWPLLRLGALAVVMLLVVGPWALRWVRRRRRLRQSVQSVATELWPRVQVWLVAARVPATSCLTPRETMTLASRHHPDVARLMAPLVDDIERAVFAPPGSAGVPTARLLAHATAVRRVLNRKRRILDRIADHLRPWRD